MREELRDLALLAIAAATVAVYNELRHTNTHMQDLAAGQREQNGRVRNLERWQARVIATGTGMLAILPLAFPAVREAVGRLLLGG